MPNPSNTQHKTTVIDQFTKQAIPFTEMPAHSDQIDRLVQLSEIKASDNALDIACGTGLVTNAFAKHCQHITGIDLTQAMIDLATKSSMDQRLANVRYQQGDAESLPFDAESFDLVVTRYSIHHIENPAKAFAEISRVCKPGARLIVADMLIQERHIESFNRVERLRDPSHRNALSSRQMLELMTQNHFTPRGIETYRVTVDLEQQLEASFPDPEDGNRFREAIRSDVGKNELGLDAKIAGESIEYSYPIAVYTAKRDAPKPAG